MKVNIYSVWDMKAEVYGKLFTCGTHAEAIRAFAGAVRQKDTNLNQNPEDYILHCLGTLNQETGFLEASHPAPVHLSHATEHIQK